ncbi:MAG: hypothetical protein AMXMBFR6_09360 [Betaproteobacteria bacterium]
MSSPRAAYPQFPASADPGPDGPWQHLHRRSIVTECFGGPDGSMRVVGLLLDDLSLPGSTYAGKHVPAGGNMHTMRVTMDVDSTLIIRSIRVEMQNTPGEPCVQIEGAYQALVGLSVARGFNRAALERIGSFRGCAHVTTLIQQMAPAVIQGVMTMIGDRPMTQGELKSIANTCHIFRPEGQIYQDLEARIAGNP